MTKPMKLTTNMFCSGSFPAPLLFLTTTTTMILLVVVVATLLVPTHGFTTTVPYSNNRHYNNNDARFVSTRLGSAEKAAIVVNGDATATIEPPTDTTNVEETTTTTATTESNSSLLETTKEAEIKTPAAVQEEEEENNDTTTDGTVGPYGVALDVSDDNPFELLAGRATMCLYQSDLRRDAVGDAALIQPSSATNWINDASAFALQKAFDKIELKVSTCPCLTLNDTRMQRHASCRKCILLQLCCFGTSCLLYLSVSLSLSLLDSLPHQDQESIRMRRPVGSVG